MQAPNWFKEARGSAVWDAIKWLWATGGSAVTLLVQWFSGWIRHHQDLTALSLTGSALAFFGIVALIIHQNPAPIKEPLSPTPTPEALPKKQERSQLSLWQFTRLRSEFACLTWAQKVAMKVLCRRYSIHELGLCVELENMGFGSGQELMDRVIKPVCASKLVDYGSTGEIVPKQAALSDIEEIVNEWNYPLI
jgi:hypothetical protein